MMADTCGQSCGKPGGNLCQKLHRAEAITAINRLVHTCPMPYHKEPYWLGFCYPLIHSLYYWFLF